MCSGTNNGGRTPALATDTELDEFEVADDDDDGRLVADGNWKSNSDGIFLLSFNTAYALVNGGSSSGCG